MTPWNLHPQVGGSWQVHHKSRYRLYVTKRVCAVNTMKKKSKKSKNSSWWKVKCGKQRITLTFTTDKLKYLTAAIKKIFLCWWFTGLDEGVHWHQPPSPRFVVCHRFDAGYRSPSNQHLHGRWEVVVWGKNGGTTRLYLAVLRPPSRISRLSS